MSVKWKTLRSELIVQQQQRLWWSDSCKDLWHRYAARASISFYSYLKYNKLKVSLEVFFHLNSWQGQDQQMDYKFFGRQILLQMKWKRCWTWCIWAHTSWAETEITWTSLLTIDLYLTNKNDCHAIVISIALHYCFICLNSTCTGGHDFGINKSFIKIHMHILVFFT